jgi:hypothetical protein
MMKPILVTQLKLMGYVRNAVDDKPASEGLRCRRDVGVGGRAVSSERKRLIKDRFCACDQEETWKLSV